MNTSPIEETIALRQIAHKRSAFYDLLGIAFRYPTRDIVERFSKEETWELVDEIKEIFSMLPFLDERINAFRKALKSVADITELQIEYTRLFIGPFRLPAAPYESVHRLESKGKLMGDATLHVKKMYLDEGLDLAGSVLDLPDHIIIELAFMAYLSEQEAFAWERDSAKVRYYLEKQDIFLTDHLTRWIPQFSEAIGRESRQELFRNLGRLLDSFIRLDKDYVRTMMHYFSTEDTQGGCHIV